MNRREFGATGSVAVIAATAGCVETVRGWIERLESDSSGIVQRAESKTFEIDAEEGDAITAEIEVMEEGDRRRSGSVTIRDPDGTELASEEVSYTGFHRDTVVVTAPQDGTYSVHVSPGSDRDAKLRVNVWIG